MVATDDALLKEVIELEQMATALLAHTPAEQRAELERIAAHVQELKDKLSTTKKAP